MVARGGRDIFFSGIETGKALVEKKQINGSRRDIREYNEDLYEFEASLVYIVSSRPTQSD